MFKKDLRTDRCRDSQSSIHNNKAHNMRHDITADDTVHRCFQASGRYIIVSLSQGQDAISEPAGSLIHPLETSAMMIVTMLAFMT